MATGRRLAAAAVIPDRVVLTGQRIPPLVHLGLCQRLHLHSLQTDLAVRLAELDPVLEHGRGE